MHDCAGSPDSPDDSLSILTHCDLAEQESMAVPFAPVHTPYNLDFGPTTLTGGPIPQHREMHGVPLRLGLAQWGLPPAVVQVLDSHLLAAWTTCHHANADYILHSM